MRYFVVSFYITLKCFFDNTFKKINSISKFFCEKLTPRSMNLRILFAILHLQRFLKLTGKNKNKCADVAGENIRCLLGPDRKINFVWLTQRREALDYAATFGRDEKIMAQLDDCAAQLNKIVKPLHDMGSPVVLAPMHMVSDILSGIVAGKAYPGNGTVIVSANAEAYQSEDRRRGGVNLTYCSIHGNNEGIAENIMSACLSAAKHDTNIIIFPDIVPEYTYKTGATFSSRINCTMFGRKASLHSGVFRLAKVISAKVVFFYLYYEDGIKIHIHPPMDKKEAFTSMPGLIESAIREHPQDWLLWHLHSLYFINH